MELKGSISKILVDVNLNYCKNISSPNEYWIDLKNFEKRYLLSNYGNIVSKCRVVKNNGGYYFKSPKFIKAVFDKGYLKINLKNDKGCRSMFLLHRLIAENFIGEVNNKVINHIDGNKNNNQITNLEIVSQRENVSHFYSYIKNTNIGVYKKRNKWVSNISINNKTIYLGTFTTAEEAKRARINYEKDNNINNKYLINGNFKDYRQNP
ncbi:HNH endonuclease [Chryseobacterium sp. DT-3]|uniref:HNH endonuclease n=1 Tax=Chryseobacterium sp. DT-3 TaxID=3396164 RepID=UPI003F1C38AB